MSTPVGLGLTFCFIGICVTPVTKGLLFKFYLGGMFLFPRSLSFDFCYDLDIWAQDQALKGFFVVMCFPPNLIKV